MKKRHLRKEIRTALEALLSVLMFVIAGIGGVIMPMLYIVGLIG